MSSLSHPSSILLPFVLENPKTPQSQPAVPVPLGSNEADKIEMFWKWGHIWVRRSASCICHFICITPRGLFIHIGLNHTQFRITIGFFSLPAMTNSIPWIHVDNPRRRSVHPAISYNGSTVARALFIYQLLVADSLSFIIGGTFVELHIRRHTHLIELNKQYRWRSLYSLSLYLLDSTSESVSLSVLPLSSAS